jgi:hypothetical protein
MCRVCDSPDVAAINDALARKESLRTVAAQFGLKYTTLRRHSVSHLRKPALAARFAPGSPAPSRIEDAHSKLDRVIRRNMALHSLPGDEMVLKALRERREYLAYEKPPVQRTKDETPRQAWDSLRPEDKLQKLARAKIRLEELEAATVKDEEAQH